MRVPYFQVDAFTRQIFSGNPAGVCLLEQWPDDRFMQQVAAENRLPATAFVCARVDGDHDLRWFSPELEINLCGHGTLATAHVLWNHGNAASEKLTFHTKGGPLAVTRRDDILALDFPARPPKMERPPANSVEVLGVNPADFGRSRDYLFLLESEEQVRALRPDLVKLAAWETFGVIVTASGSGVDFVSRFFAPRTGLPEDPATGSSHCTLVPYWAARLNKTTLHARQVSARAGEFQCRLLGDRVEIAGHAVTYCSGTIPAGPIRPR